MQSLNGTREKTLEKLRALDRELGRGGSPPADAAAGARLSRACRGERASRSHLPGRDGPYRCAAGRSPRRRRERRRTQQRAVPPLSGESARRQSGQEGRAGSDAEPSLAVAIAGQGRARAVARHHDHRFHVHPPGRVACGERRLPSDRCDGSPAAGRFVGDAEARAARGADPHRQPRRDSRPQPGGDHPARGHSARHQGRAVRRAVALLSPARARSRFRRVLQGAGGFLDDGRSRRCQLRPAVARVRERGAFERPQASRSRRRRAHDRRGGAHGGRCGEGERAHVATDRSLARSRSFRRQLRPHDDHGRGREARRRRQGRPRRPHQGAGTGTDPPQHHLHRYGRRQAGAGQCADGVEPRGLFLRHAGARDGASASGRRPRDRYRTACGIQRARRMRKACRSFRAI